MLKKLSSIARTTACFAWILLTPASSVKADALDHWTPDIVPGHPYALYGSAFSAIAFGNGRYVAVGADPSSDYGFGLISSDGVNWANITNIVGTYQFLDLYDVTYGGGLFVAVGYDWYTGQNIYTSTNGTDWIRAPAQSFNANFYRVAYGLVSGGLPPGSPGYDVYVAFGDGMPISSGGPSGYNIMMSDDGGQTWWETMAPGSSGGLRTVACGAGRFVALDYANNVFISDNGYFWSKSTNIPAGSINFCNGQFIISSGVGTNMVSTNGLTWTISTNDAPVGMGRIIYQRGHYLATSGNTILSSTDSVHWIQHALPSPTNYFYWSGFTDIEMGPTNAVVLGYYIATNRLTDVPVACVSDSFLSLSPAAAGQVNLSGLLGCPYRIESIDNLGGTNLWQTVDTFPLSASPFTWTDPQPADRPSRFYRAVLLP